MIKIVKRNVNVVKLQLPIVGEIPQVVAVPPGHARGHRAPGERPGRSLLKWDLTLLAPWMVPPVLVLAKQVGPTVQSGSR